MQRWTGKVVGGVLGLVALGPFGALLGMLLGHQLDASSEEPPALSPLDTGDTGERFFHITFRVMGHLAKADGRVSEREIAAARAVMSDLYLNASQVHTAIECFTAGKDPTFNLDADLAQLRGACAGRPDLLHVFVELQVRAALAGNDLGGPVSALLVRVASQLGISRIELAQIEAVMRIRRDSFARAPHRDTGQQLTEAYRVLEAPAAASNEEVSKAYRRQLSRHHPDKLKANGLPDSMIEHAKQRTQQIIEAYELIRNRRGF
jgi:DnaJ like chaperone protein